MPYESQLRINKIGEDAFWAEVDYYYKAQDVIFNSQGKLIEEDPYWLAMAFKCFDLAKLKSTDADNWEALNCDVHLYYNGHYKLQCLVKEKNEYGVIVDKHWIS